MPWVTIAEGTSEEELRTVVPDITDIPKGTRGRIEIHAPLAGRLFDLAGMEQIAGFFLPAEVKIIDVYGEGWNKGFILFEATGSAIMTVIYCILVALAALGILSILNYFGISIFKGAGFPWPYLLIGAGVIGSGLLIASALRRR